MSEFMFGVSRNKPLRKHAKVMRRVAKRHDAYLVEANIPGTGYQRWFCTRNYGHPHDQATADAVYRDLALAGVPIDSET